MKKILLAIFVALLVACDGSSTSNRLQQSSIVLDLNEMNSNWVLESSGDTQQQVEANWAPLQVRIDAVTADSISVSWPELTGTSGYQLHAWRSDLGRGFTGDEPGSNPAVTVLTEEVSLASGVSSYVFSGLNTNRPYRIDIAARNSDNQLSMNWTSPEVTTAADGALPDQTVDMQTRLNSLFLHKSTFDAVNDISEANILARKESAVPPVTINIPQDAPRELFITVKEENFGNTFSNQLGFSRYETTASFVVEEIEILRGLLVTETAASKVIVAGENYLVALDEFLQNDQVRNINPDSDYATKCEDEVGTFDSACQNHPVTLDYLPDLASFYYCGSGLRRGIAANPSDANELGAVQCHIVPVSQFASYDFTAAGFNNTEHMALSVNRNTLLGSHAIEVTPSQDHPGLYDEILSVGIGFGRHPLSGLFSNFYTRTTTPFLFRSAINSAQDAQEVTGYLVQPSAAGSGGREWLRFPALPVSSFFVDDYAYHFYTANESSGSVDQIESYVSRNCKNDTGPSDDANAHFFQSFYSARMFCELEVPPGEDGYGNIDFQFNYLAGVTKPTGNIQRAFGVFNSNRVIPDVGDTAICLYNFFDSSDGNGQNPLFNRGLYDIFLEDLEDDSDGREYEKLQRSCDPTDSGYLVRDAAQAEHRYRQVQRVNQIDEDPIFILPGEQTTAVVQKSDDPTRLLLATTSGRIYDLQLTDSLCLYNLTCAFSVGSPGLTIRKRYEISSLPVRALELDPSSPQRIYALTSREVHLITLD